MRIESSRLVEKITAQFCLHFGTSRPCGDWKYAYGVIWERVRASRLARQLLLKQKPHAECVMIYIREATCMRVWGIVCTAIRTTRITSFLTRETESQFEKGFVCMSV